MKVCARCGHARPLIEFRRFSRGKVRERPDCNVCSPPKTLAQMSEKERHRALLTTHRTTSPAFIERLNRNAKARKAERLSVKIRSHKAKERERNWCDAILKQARVEVKWAGACLLRYRKVMDGVGVEVGEKSPRAPYVAFFAAYTAHLKRMVGEIEDAMRRSTALRPTPEQSSPLTYTDYTTKQTLRALYAQCLPIPGARTAREPWLLYWRE